MKIKFTSLEHDLLSRINKTKSRGEDISKFSEVHSKAFHRLLSAGFAEDIDGYAYVTNKGLKKLSNFK